jgi:hypothetical protein
MSGLTYCLGDVDSQNCANICMQSSDCDPSQPGEICCTSNIGAFCIDKSGDFVAPADCYKQMGADTQCEQIPNKGTIIHWEYLNKNENSVTANMLISKDDPQYQDYMQEFCKNK